MRVLAVLISLFVIAAGAVLVLPQHIEDELLAAPFMAQPVAESKADVLFGGDLMFDRSVRQFADRNGSDALLRCLDPVLESPDLVVANLEGPVTNNASVSVGSASGAPDNYVFTFAPTTPSLLVRHHIGLVSLGNNHIENFGTDGVLSTISYLSLAGEDYFGDPLNNTVANLDIGGVPLSFINYNQFIPAGGTASTTRAQIAYAKAQGRMPVVYAHWGVEYATTAPAYVVSLAHSFVDAGAVAVIGSHPHVVEQNEVYNGAVIYYSLGNMIFDQYFSDEVEHGLLVELSFSQKGVAVEREIPIELSSRESTCPQ
jgi:poly-gamma-glutamate synthesis protein (capsule biosynthesis protein)